jgi:hypothetical protein
MHSSSFGALGLVQGPNYLLTRYTVPFCLVFGLQLLQQLMMNNPSGAVSLAKMVAKQTPPPVDINTMADLFLQVRHITTHESPCVSHAPGSASSCGALFLDDAYSSVLPSSTHQLVYVSALAM